MELAHFRSNLVVSHAPFIVLLVIVMTAKSALAILVVGRHFHPRFVAIETDGDDARHVDGHITLLGIVEVHLWGVILLIWLHSSAIDFALNLLLAEALLVRGGAGFWLAFNCGIRADHFELLLCLFAAILDGLHQDNKVGLFRGAILGQNGVAVGGQRGLVFLVIKSVNLVAVYGAFGTAIQSLAGDELADGLDGLSILADQGERAGLDGQLNLLQADQLAWRFDGDVGMLLGDWVNDHAGQNLSVCPVSAVLLLLLGNQLGIGVPEVGGFDHFQEAVECILGGRLQSIVLGLQVEFVQEGCAAFQAVLLLLLALFLLLLSLLCLSQLELSPC